MLNIGVDFGMMWAIPHVDVFGTPSALTKNQPDLPTAAIIQHGSHCRGFRLK